MSQGPSSITTTSSVTGGNTRGGGSSVNSTTLGVSTTTRSLNSSSTRPTTTQQDSTTATTTTTASSTNNRRFFNNVTSPRKIWYCALFLSSLIAMGSTFEAVKMQRRYTASTIPPTPQQQWSVSSITITFILTFIILSLQMISPSLSTKYIHGTKLEMMVLLLLSGLTMSSVGMATNPAYGLAVNSYGGISYGNLYYATWSSFITALGGLISYIRTERGIDIYSEVSSRGIRFRHWSMLIIVTVIVMGSSASCYDVKCDELYNEVHPVKYCRRAAFGVSAGCIGCVSSLSVVVMRLVCATPTPEGKANKTIFILECILSVILFGMYGFAVAYLTSEQGPGAPLGNLYYSVWVSFALIFLVATSCFEEFQAAKNMILLGRSRQQDGTTNSVYEREALNSDVSIAASDFGTSSSPYADDYASIADEGGGGPQSSVASSAYSSRVTGSVGEVQI